MFTGEQENLSQKRISRDQIPVPARQPKIARSTAFNWYGLME